MEKTYISIDTARRFSKLVWAIKDTPYWYHQTLTFGGMDAARANIKLANRRLKTFLDQLEKAYPDCACIWVRERQWNKGIHFHLLILFWGERGATPETFLRQLRPDLFHRWKTINGGAPVQEANELNIGKYRAQDMRSFGYLTEQVRIDEKTHRAGRGEAWWGRRNTALLEANSTRLSKAEASHALKLLFKRRRRYLRIAPANWKHKQSLVFNIVDARPCFDASDTV